MSDEDRPDSQGPEPQGETPAPPPPAPRSANLAVVAAAVILVGLVAYALSRRAAGPSAPAAPAPGPEATPPPLGAAIAAVVPFHLTPEAAIVAERYRCPCACGELLNVCTCSKTPGSNDMKRALQELVNAKRLPDEIDRAMVQKFGPQVLLANPAPTPTPAPKRPARRRAR